MNNEDSAPMREAAEKLRAMEQARIDPKHPAIVDLSKPQREWLIRGGTYRRIPDNITRREWRAKRRQQLKKQVRYVKARA